MPSLRVTILALAAALAGCATVKIKTEYDPTAPYASYRTYAWISADPGPEQAPAIRNPQVRALVVKAVDREMKAKGLVLVAPDAKPDFLVTVLGWAQSEIHVTNYGYAYGGAYAYGPYGATPMVVPVTEVHQYTQGTMLLDFVDAKTTKLVWRGTATDTLGSPESIPATVDEAVKKLLAAYPPK
jgi:hypothetical protein